MFADESSFERGASDWPSASKSTSGSGATRFDFDNDFDNDFDSDFDGDFDGDEHDSSV
jgi:hypothetical protein